jgi:dethiobiotin synthetase
MTTKAKTKKPSPAPCLAVLGTGSDVGKSVIAAALCRIFADRGLRVAPYKAQNMSNNSGVTPEGLEMGRAQIVQAEAAGIAPHVDMNPILLKPTSDVGSQVVLLGEAIGNQTAMDYHQRKTRLVQTANAALDRLRDRYDLVVMEGAGSCAEVNLMAHDIVNFPMAAYADAPVILVGDIHRGGIFAQLVGTLECLPPHFKRRVAGFIINRFRGDLRLFTDGVAVDRTANRAAGIRGAALVRPHPHRPRRFGGHRTSPNGQRKYGRHTRSGGNPHPPHLQLFRFRSAQGGDGDGPSFCGNPPGSIHLCRRDPARLQEHPLRPRMA